MSTYRHVIVRNSSEEVTCAVIEITSENADYADPSYVLERVRRAVATGITEGDLASAYRDARDDLNIGDLVAYGCEDQLARLLGDVEKLSFEIFSEDVTQRVWSFDTSLAPDTLR